MNIGDRFYRCRVGWYDEFKPIDKCKDIEDYMCIEFLTISKVNKNSFRVEENDLLYKEIPSGYRQYTELNKYRRDLCVEVYKNIIDYGYQTTTRARKAFELLDEAEKGLVCRSLHLNAKKKSDSLYQEIVKKYNSNLNESTNEWNYKDKLIIENYLNKEDLCP